MAHSLPSGNYRKLFILAGNPPWAKAAATKIIAPFDRKLWVGEAPVPGFNAIPSNKARQWLGRELDALVFDSFCGFDPEAFGALSGTVVGGGILVLLTPPLDSWQGFADPDKSRFTPYPHDPDQSESGFLRRFVRFIREDQHLVLSEEGISEPAELFEPPPPPDEEPHFQLTGDQEAAVEALIKVATAHSRRPLVLISDRGRGKSTALGIAAARLLLLGKQQITITAPRPDAAATLLNQAGLQLPEHTRHGNNIEYQQGEIVFIPPDELIRNPRGTDLLLVDEAAAIPAPQLERLLKSYNRIAFATTEHGYEGTGRGFTVRFTEILQRETPHWRRLRLQSPIRWSDNDPLEDFVFRSLLLNAEIAEIQSNSDFQADDALIERVEQNLLLEDENLLSQLFGLLVLSHYQTRSSDLRQLLDSPGLSIWVTRLHGKVVGAILSIDEGGLGDELAVEIWKGKRRPKGHMMAQTLTSHAGFKEAARHKFRRIMRIAIHPQLNRKGLGANLVNAVTEDARRQEIDFIGASFGATTGLLKFWRNSGMAAVHMGVSRDAASGCHSAVVLQSLSETGKELYLQMRARFVAALPLLLADPLRGLEADIALNLFHGETPFKSHAEGHLNQKDWDDLEAFAHGYRDYSGAQLAMWRLTNQLLCSAKQQKALRILIIKVLQGQDWEHCAQLLQLPGRKAVTLALRDAVAELIATNKHLSNLDIAR